MIHVRIPAKVNLSLLVTGQEDGYHRLDSVVASAAIYDEIYADRANEDEIVGDVHPFVIDKIAKLTTLMRARFGFGAVKIQIRNAVPLGAGLGGSSVACAGVIRALDSLFALGLTDSQMDEIADTTGSDTRFLCRGGCGRIQGRSAVTQWFSMPSGKAAIAVKGVSETPKAFAYYDQDPVSLAGNNDELIKLLTQGKTAQALPLLVNDLQPAVCAFVPAVKQGFSLCKGGFMTGSGCGIVFLDPDQNTIQVLQKHGYTVYVTHIGDFPVTLSEV